MHEAEFKYKTGMEKLVYKPGLSVTEFINADVIAGLFRLQIFSSFSTHIRKYFSNEKLLSLMEFPVLFLGAMPEETPALYSLMNYAGLKAGTWYPQGGFGKVVDAFVELAKSLGVKFHFNTPVEKINTSKDSVVSVSVDGVDFSCDGVIASADYHHVENKLLDTSKEITQKNIGSKKPLLPLAWCFISALTES
jgi:phytoene desaturase